MVGDDVVALARQSDGDGEIAGGDAAGFGVRLQPRQQGGRQGHHRLALAAGRKTRRQLEPGQAHLGRGRPGQLAQLAVHVDRRGLVCLHVRQVRAHGRGALLRRQQRPGRGLDDDVQPVGMDRAPGRRMDLRDGRRRRS